MTTKKQLKYRLAADNLNISQVAQAIGVSYGAVYQVLRGRTISRRIQAVLEAVFNMPIADIRAAWANDPPATVSTDTLAQILRAAGISTEQAGSKAARGNRSRQ